MTDDGSLPEEQFVKLFSEVCGIDKVAMLAPQYPVTDIYGNSRFIDYALQTPFFRVAFEIDGLTWHHPAVITIEKFERRSFMKYARDLAYLRFDGHLWRQLTESDKNTLRSFCHDAVRAYFDRK